MSQSEREWSVFSRRFAGSRPAIFRVAEYIHREIKLTVTIPRMVLANSVAQSLDYRDEGDIIARTEKGTEFIIEVKHMQKDFTSAEDFGWPDILVAGKTQADRLKPFAYFCVNRNMTHAFMVKYSTRDRWIVKEIPDKERGDKEEKYAAPIGIGEFVKL
jgi:hypothetical protein